MLVVIWIGYHQSEPDFATIPTGPTTKVVVVEGHKTCVSVNPEDVQEHRGSWWAHGLVTVDRSPIGVTALWLPGLNAQACEDQLTHYGRSVATALADGIRSSPKFPSWHYNCPADDGSEVILFFHYSGGGVPEVVNASLSGCQSIDAPGMGSRMSDAAFTNELRTHRLIAPGTHIEEIQMAERAIARLLRWCVASVLVVFAVSALGGCGSSNASPATTTGPTTPATPSTPVTIRIMLPRTRVVAGPTINGTALITNNTSKTITVEACAADGWIDVGLVNTRSHSIRPHRASPALRRFT